MNYFFSHKEKNTVIALALWAGLCQWHKGIAKSIFDAVSGKKKLKFAIDNIAHLSAWTEITHTYYDGLFFHHISLKILAISKDMPVLFASSVKKIVFVKYGTYFCPSTYLNNLKYT